MSRRDLRRPPIAARDRRSSAIRVGRATFPLQDPCVWNAYAEAPACPAAAAIAAVRGASGRSEPRRASRNRSALSSPLEMPVNRSASPAFRPRSSQGGSSRRAPRSDASDATVCVAAKSSCGSSHRGDSLAASALCRGLGRRLRGRARRCPLLLSGPHVLAHLGPRVDARRLGLGRVGLRMLSLVVPIMSAACLLKDELLPLRR